MKAAQLIGYGGNEVIHIATDVPTPNLAPEHILVAVHAAGVNPSDWKLREGMMKDAVHATFPFNLGGDFSGVVTQVGEGVAGFAIGDEVYGQSDIREMGSGAFAEFSAPHASYIAQKPITLSDTEAAALPLTACSAWQVIMEHMKLAAGQRILIHGGAGGIGTIAIQMAKHVGAFVATTATGDDTNYVTQLGANQVIDYKTEHFEDLLHDFDAVFDTVGGETYTKSFSVLKRGGIIVSMLMPPNQELMDQFGVTAIAQASKVTTERLTRIAELVDQGAIKVTIDKSFSLDQTADALEYLKTSHTKGK